ncbi:hypothetical protein BMS3Bbin09_00822 [bacterium BMS3Bbin09]|nr:hypothetical protein BMS3Bbin09_00822 [bacterium BMS3Bbin09]
MHIAAIHNLPKNKEELAGALASALGVTLYEAGARLRVPGNGPIVVAVSGEHKVVEDIADKLHAKGFEAIVVNEDEIETGSSQFIVRKFSLDERELVVESRDGESLVIDYSGIDLILRGTCIAVSSKTETIKKKKFSPGMAILSSGLIINKTTKVTREIITENREGFFNLYCENRPTTVFFENDLTYDSLGSEMKPSRMANFTYLLAELRQRQPDAIFDDRLLRRAEQALLLGPLLSPEDHLDVAIALLVKALRQKK